MTEPEEALEQVLEWIEEHIDLEHVREVEKRHRDVLYYRSVDRPPVSVACDPSPEFPYFPYAEGFYDQTKMMVNELVRPFCHDKADVPSVVSSLETGDDFPLQIRANYGVTVISSLFGAEVVVRDGSMPWVRPIGREKVIAALDKGVPDLHGGVGGRVIETMDFYRTKLADYPRARQAIHVTQPDLQGTFDNLHLLWGKDLFVGLYDEPELVHKALDLVAQTYSAYVKEIRPHTTEDVGEDCIALHWGVLRGNVILKNDTSIMVSPQAYAEFVRPHDEQIFAACGPGAIHFCGSADHLRDEMLATQGLTTHDFGQPEMNDLAAWYRQARERNISFMHMLYPSEDILSGQYRQQFPTGMQFVTKVADVAAGRRLMEAVRGQ